MTCTRSAGDGHHCDRRSALGRGAGDAIAEGVSVKSAASESPQDGPHSCSAISKPTGLRFADSSLNSGTELVPKSLILAKFATIC